MLRDVGSHVNSIDLGGATVSGAQIVGKGFFIDPMGSGTFSALKLVGPPSAPPSGTVGGRACFDSAGMLYRGSC